MLDLSRPDWEKRIRLGQSLIPDSAHGLNAYEAGRAIGIFDKLKLPDVPGTPPLSEAAGPWFREIVGAFMGSVVDGERMIRELFLLAVKKSSKTSYGAAMMMTALLMNKRPRAEFLLIAPTQAVAELAFSQAEGMILIDPEGFLQKRMHVQAHLKTITDRRTRAQLKIKTFDSSVLTGVKPAGVLLDELHEISRNARAGAIIRQIRGGLIPNPEAFLAIITTQSEDRPQGAFKAELDHARAVRDGREKSPMLAVLYEFPKNIAAAGQHGEEPKWADPVYWPMVMPNLGRPVTIERLLPEFETAKQKGFGELRGWASQHLNVEMGLGLRTDHWAGAEYWDRGADASLTLNALLDRSDVAIVGIDGGGLDDLFGLAVLGRDRETKDWLAWIHAWCHDGVLQRRQQIAVQLTEFSEAGELTIVDDRLNDLSEIVEVVDLVKRRGLLFAVAIDPAGIGEFVNAMAEIDVTQENKMLVGVGQGFRLMNAIKTAERRLASGTLSHNGSGLAAWCVNNLRIEPMATAIRATKQVAGDSKIDPIMALFNAVDLMSTNPDARGSIYDDPAEYARAFGRQTKAADNDVWLPEILADMTHPLFAEHRRRFETWQDRHAEDEF